jgi:hypothetical protein
MDTHIIVRRRIWIGVAILVLVSGCLGAATLIGFKLTSYPSLIKEAYRDPLQKIEVPGEADIELNRKGAYAVYFETDQVPEGPPVMDCVLSSKTTGDDIPLVPDFVPTNRYSTKDGSQVGVLIYSTTIDPPGSHKLSCKYPDRHENPKITLAIGPNYFYEFLRVAWKLGGALIGGVALLCGSVILAMGIVSAVIVKTKRVGNEKEWINDNLR